MKRVVITINRQYGSGGKTIGYMLAEKLGIPCYSREILQRASEESGINESMFNARDERLKRLPKFLLSTNVYSGELLPPESKEFTSDQNLFNYEAEIIKKYAAEGSCVLIGRCADFVLKDDPRIRSCRSRFPDEIRIRACQHERKRDGEIHRTNQQIPFRLLSLSHRKKLG